MRGDFLAGSITRHLRTAGVALALSVLAACAPQDTRPKDTRPDGTKLVLAGSIQSIEERDQQRVTDLEIRRDWDGLAKLAEENIPRNQHKADWWLVAGYAYSQSGRHAQAVERLAERVRLAPDEMLGWRLLAQSYRDSGQAQRAVQTLNNAHLVRSGTLETWYLLGESYTDLNRYLPAAAAYREATQLDRGFAPAWFGLGRAYSRLGRRTEYAQALKTLEQLNPALAKELAEMRPGPRN